MTLEFKFGKAFVRRHQPVSVLLFSFRVCARSLSLALFLSRFLLSLPVCTAKILEVCEGCNFEFRSPEKNCFFLFLFLARSGSLSLSPARSLSCYFSALKHHWVSRGAARHFGIWFGFGIWFVLRLVSFQLEYRIFLTCISIPKQVLFTSWV